MTTAIEHHDYDALLEIALKESVTFERAVTDSLHQLRIDTHRGRLSLQLIFAALEHFRAIIHLLDDGEHKNSAYALVRPVADASFRAIWVAHFATDQQIASLRTTHEWPKHPPTPPTVAASMNAKFGWNDEELIRLIKQDWGRLSGYVHPDFGSLKRDLAAKRAKQFPHQEAFDMLIRSAATYLWLAACFVAQLDSNKHVMLQMDKAHTTLCNRTGTYDPHRVQPIVSN